MMKHKHLAKHLAASFSTLVLVALVGCASTMVAPETQRTDEGLTSVVEASLEASQEVKGRQVEVSTREGVVHLTGVVETEEIRREAARVAWRVDGVTGVMNLLTVGERTVGSWVDDVMISSKVKSKLITDTQVRARDIDVSSSQGVVTLIGRVSSEAIKQDAERTARGTKGVTDVNNELFVGKAKS